MHNYFQSVRESGARQSQRVSRSGLVFNLTNLAMAPQTATAIFVPEIITLETLRFQD